MLTRGEDVEAHALQKRGWSISAIARHLDRDRKTVRSYLNGDRVPGTRVRPDTPDPLAEYEKYLTARFTDDHHVWGTVLFEEVTALGYSQSYPTFVRQIRKRGLRPHCEACRGAVGRRSSGRGPETSRPASHPSPSTTGRSSSRARPDEATAKGRARLDDRPV